MLFKLNIKKLAYNSLENNISQKIQFLYEK